MKKISVIIPVYNVQGYLKDCLDSILMQSSSDYEIVLVDDGSTDRSGELCDEYARKYDNIFAFHKENGGPSDARNYGIEKSNGEYIVFVDSDDYFDDCKILEKIIEASKNGKYDIVAYCIKFYDAVSGNLQKTHIYDECINSLPSLEEKLTHTISRDQMIISSCGYAIKRDFILKNSLLFEKGIYDEDTERTMRIFSCDPSIIYINEPSYCTRRGRVGSASTEVSNKNIRDLLYVIKKHATSFKDSSNPCQRILVSFLAYKYCVLCGIYGYSEGKDFRRGVLNEIIQYRWLLDYSLNPKVRRTRKMCKLLGIKCTVKILSFYLKHRRSK